MYKEKYRTLKDNDLIQKIKSGESSRYFDILYERYQKKVFDKCYSIVKNKKTAIELMEDIFSKTYEKLNSFKNISSFSSWLYSITYNHCIDYLREKKKLHYPHWNQNNEISEIIDENEEITEPINYDNLLRVMDEIHPEEKALLIMKYQDNISIKQIGQSLRISEDAAKMRLKRARARVFYLYKKKFGFD